MAKISLDHLGADHLQPFRQAILYTMATPAAANTYAQIAEGMPVSEIYNKHHRYSKDFPVNNHNDLTWEAYNKAFGAKFELDFTLLRFESKTVQAYQDAAPGSIAWKLRLIELLAVAIHDIAVVFWVVDSGRHTRAEFEAWRTSRLESEPQDELERANLPPHTWFWHPEYTDYLQYPNGAADIVGYWAETMIFGGVVVFDRGESGEECNGVYLHNAEASIRGYTIAPPTEDQFTQLVDFLVSPEPDLEQAPLPIDITRANRWRWDPYEAMATYHIFRDRYERKLPPRELHVRKHSVMDRDWPEFAEVRLLRSAAMGDENIEEAEMSAAKERLRQITPSSPNWPQVEAEVCMLQPDKKKQGRPPYFFDE